MKYTCICSLSSGEDTNRRVIDLRCDSTFAVHVWPMTMNSANHISIMY